MLWLQTRVSCTWCKRYSSSLSQDLVYLGMQPGSCDTSSLLGGQSNFTYCQYFQWSSSALVNLISIDQLFVLDSVISENIIHSIFHRKYLEVSTSYWCSSMWNYRGWHTWSFDATSSMGMFIILVGVILCKYNSMFEPTSLFKICQQLNSML